ncbi:MAG: site-specific DNA-methyltransferase [Firmicutes bacterium]|nr:site-specific DNA-methyltransferase [Bacillota bacterium]
MIGLRVIMQTQKGIVFQGDCIDMLRGVRSGVINTVFADPPFNLGKSYKNGKSDSIAHSDYLDWCREWLHECVRVIRDGGSLFVYNLPKWNVSLAHYLMSQEKMTFRHWIAISIKACGARQKLLYPAHYSLIYLTKGEPVTFNRDSVRYPMPTCRRCGTPLPDWGGYKDRVHPLGINLSDVWVDVTPVRHRSTKIREFGINELDPKIPERAILLTTNRGDIVLDPFGGGGSTYRMAEKYDRLWVGSEIGDCTAIIEGLRAMHDITVNPQCPSNGLLDIFSTSLRAQIPKCAPLPVPS